MKKVENFFAALRNLEEIVNYQEPYNVVELTGMVALYEICFEQAWKAMKELLEESGVDEAQTGSPKAVLRAAWKAKLIDDDQQWLAALQARNSASHAYNKEIALSVLEETRNIYLELFRKLKKTMEQNWLNE